MARRRSRRRKQGTSTGKLSGRGIRAISYKNVLRDARKRRIRYRKVKKTALAIRAGEPEALAKRPRPIVRASKALAKKELVRTRAKARKVFEAVRASQLPRVRPGKTMLEAVRAYRLAPRNVCAERAARRQVIFATGRSGRGSHGSYRRTASSAQGCK